MPKPRSPLPPLALVAGALGRRLFPVAWLAERSGLSRRVFDGMLREAKIDIVRVGRSHFVSLSEIEDRLPLLWESLLWLEPLRWYTGPHHDP
jgi:hypothetical protein